MAVAPFSASGTIASATTKQAKPNAGGAASAAPAQAIAKAGVQVAASATAVPTTSVSASELERHWQLEGSFGNLAVSALAQELLEAPLPCTCCTPRTSSAYERSASAHWHVYWHDHDNCRWRQ